MKGQVYGLQFFLGDPGLQGLRIQDDPQVLLACGGSLSLFLCQGHSEVVTEGGEGVEVAGALI